MRGAFADLPGLRPETVLTVALPARDEAATLPAALTALATQVDRFGRALPTDRFDVIVFANSCRDATAATARAFARQHSSPAIYVVEADLPREAAHIGTARGAVMDAAAKRFLATNRPEGIVATTDADSIVDADWIAATVSEMNGADAVTGRISIRPCDLAGLSAHAASRYLLDEAYRAVVADLEAIRDPVAYDPLPRHAHHFGASFAVSSVAYRRAGGLPRLPRMEDIALYTALHRIDARVRHSPYVSVTTSARVFARVDGGLATRLGEYATQSDGSQSHVVEGPDYTIARIDARAALRRIWNGTSRFPDVHRVATTYGVTLERFRWLFDANDTFGSNAERLERNGDRALKNPALVPIRVALALLASVRASSEALTTTTVDESAS